MVIADRSDNAGAGAASELDVHPRRAVERHVHPRRARNDLGSNAVRSCHDAGVGARLPLRIGGQGRRWSGSPIDADVEGPRCAPTRAGAVRSRTAAGTAGQICRGAHRRRRRHRCGPHLTPPAGVQVRNCFTEHGIDLPRRHIVVVKSMQHFMGGFARSPRASSVARGRAAQHWTCRRSRTNESSDRCSVRPVERSPRTLSSVRPIRQFSDSLLDGGATNTYPGRVQRFERTVIQRVLVYASHGQPPPYRNPPQ